MIGRVLGRYRVLARLGAGGMGEVYRAEDSSLGRQVALKVLPEEVTAEPDRLRRFRQEARTLAALNHPGVVTVHSVEEEGGIHFLTMELIEGRTLHELIPPGGFPPDSLLSLALSLSDAVAAAHSLGVVHRDLKPANVMVTDHGRLKVLDFGLAKWASQEQDVSASLLSTEAATQLGTAVGTVPYMSPEQVEGRPADARSDVFALGIILYELATGRRPFSGDSAAAVGSAILRDTPAPLSATRGDLPERLSRIVLRCLAKRPADRYQSVADLRHDLAELQEHPTPTPEPSIRHPGRGGRRSLRWPLIVLGCVATGAAILGWLVVRHGRGAQVPSGAGVIRSLAVLPFANLMKDPSQDYFVEGMQDTLITTLAQIHPLRVTSRTSAMRFKDTDQTVPEIARALGVDAVIEGSVLRAGGRVRITAQLIRGATDEHLWAQSYDRDVENVLSLLSDVASAIATEVEITLTPEQRQLLADARPVRPEVQEAYLLGKHAWNSFTRSGWEEALVHFRKAIGLDPEFAPAWASLAATEMIRSIFGQVSRSEGRKATEEAARRALELDPTLGVAYGALGYSALYLQWDWETARENLVRAVELDPTDAMVRHGYADLLLVEGKPEESLAQVELGRQYDPLNPVANGVVLGHLVFVRRYRDLLAEIDHFRTMLPDSLQGTLSAYEFRGLWHLDRREEALEVLHRRWEEVDPELLAALDRGLDSNGPPGALVAIAQALERRLGTGGVEPLEVARYYALGGDSDHAMAILEQAYTAHTPFLLHIGADPAYDGVRSDPRFADLVRRIGFPD